MTPTTPDLLDQTAVHGTTRRDTALAVNDPAAEMFERLARDPNASVDKIERLMALWERNEVKKAEAAFNEAMSHAQADMRPVAADATNPQTHSDYASYAALDRALRPIYTKHGFGLSFDSGIDAPPDYVRVCCYVTHLCGFSRTYHLDMPADGKGAKGGDVMTKTHAVGSAMSYGMRYLLKMVFNVAVGEDDDDGNSATAREPEAPVTAPRGFDDWLMDLAHAAKLGTAKLSQAFNGGAEPLRKHLLNTNKRAWEQLKIEAGKVKP